VATNTLCARLEWRAGRTGGMVAAAVLGVSWAVVLALSGCLWLLGGSFRIESVSVRTEFQTIADIVSTETRQEVTSGVALEIHRFDGLDVWATDATEAREINAALSEPRQTRTRLFGPPAPHVTILLVDRSPGEPHSAYRVWARTSGTAVLAWTSQRMLKNEISLALKKAVGTSIPASDLDAYFRSSVYRGVARMVAPEAIVHVYAAIATTVFLNSVIGRSQTGAALPLWLYQLGGLQFSPVPEQDARRRRFKADLSARSRAPTFIEVLEECGKGGDRNHSLVRPAAAGGGIWLEVAVDVTVSPRGKNAPARERSAPDVLDSSLCQVLGDFLFRNSDRDGLAQLVTSWGDLAGEPREARAAPRRVQGASPAIRHLDEKWSRFVEAAWSAASPADMSP
jgi:hypothetical protein